MHYCEAPNDWLGSPRPRVFMAGGILDCPNWQLDLRKELDARELVGTLFNPRRVEMPKDVGREQIEWEYEALRTSDIILFWFARGGMNRVTHYEYGTHLTRWQLGDPPLRQVIVGIDQEYAHRNGVLIQTEMRLPWMRVHRSFDSFIGEVAAAIKVLELDD